MIISLMKSLFIQGRSLFLQAGNITKIERFFGVFNEIFIYSGKKCVQKASCGLDRDLNKVINFKEQEVFLQREGDFT